MSDWLNQMYTDPQQVVAAEEQLKIAYAQVAADNGINLANYTPEQIAADFTQFVEKLAAEGEHEAHESAKEEKKEEEAKKEHEKKKEETEKKAEAAMMGQLMFENFAKSAAANGVDLILLTKIASEASDAYRERAAAGQQNHLTDVPPEAAAARAKSVEEHAKKVEEHAKKGPGMFSGEGAIGRHLKWKGTSTGSKVLKGVGAAAGLTAAGLGAAHAAGAFGGKKEEEKAASVKTSSPNLDQFAFAEAVKIAEAYEWDPTEAANRVAFAYNNGYVADSEKIAAVQDLDQAVTVRGFEMLESAGYPVNWEGVQAIVFGQ